MAAGNSLPVLHGLFLCLCGAFAAPLRRGDWPFIASSNRTEHLLIYRIQSHTNPKRRKFCLKHAGQKSVKEELPEQRKAPKRAVECQLKIQTHIWEQDAGSSNPVTSTIPFRNQTPCSYLSTGFSAVSLSAIRKTKNKKPARWVALYRAGFLYGFLAYCIYI